MPADEISYNTTAALSGLKVDGHPVPDFDPSTTTYTVTSTGRTDITATAGDNGRVTIAEPVATPGVAP